MANVPDELVWDDGDDATRVANGGPKRLATVCLRVPAARGAKANSPQDGKEVYGWSVEENAGMPALGVESHGPGSETIGDSKWAQG